MRALGEATRGPGCVFLTGGATAVLLGWRASTIGVDLKFDPEPAGAFDALRVLKDDLDLNVELAAPEDFIPVPPERRRLGRFIAEHGQVRFYHYDLPSQVLAKIERGHSQDLADVHEFLARGWVNREEILELFPRIRPELTRYPAIDPDDFQAKVEQIAGRHEVDPDRNEQRNPGALPGEDLVTRGLDDLQRGVESVEALLVAVGAPRLRRAGVAVPPPERLPPSPEHRLYALLGRQGPRGAHSRYNAWIRRLVSFERGLEFARARDLRRAP